MSNTEKDQEVAAAKAGMEPTTARRYMRLERLPSELKKDCTWRTRGDPFSEVWDAVQKQMEESPGLEAKTLFEWLQREHPGRFSDGQIRTLQRRIKLWRVTEGPAREMYFGQVVCSQKLVTYLNQELVIRSHCRDVRVYGDVTTVGSCSI